MTVRLNDHMLAVESSVRTGWAIRATATAIVALAVMRIASTYAVFNHTYDEPFHVLRGMLWITDAPYRHVEHPPLAPICLAIGPYLDGAVVVDTGDKVKDGNRILYENGNYWRTLTLARMGNLGFFIWSAVVVWRWASMLRGPGLALLAVALYTTLPPVLAHAGVATTDMAITATLSAFLYALMRWLDEATPCRALVLGGATGLALLAKMSALLFLPVATLVVLGLYLLAGPQRPRDDSKRSGRLLQGVVIALIGVELVFAGYRFSVGPVRTTRERSELPQFAIDLLADDGLIGSAARRTLSASIPAPEFFRGILSIIKKDEQGHAPYFLGQARHDASSWTFFPVVLAVKTPLPFLAMFGLGLFAVFRDPSPSARWNRWMAPSVAAALILAVLPAGINLGVRHILPIYPLLSIVAAYGVMKFCRGVEIQWLHGGWLAASLLGWLLVSSARAHPDYLSYFNELAGRHPDYFVVDSDLDWGQDLSRLSDEFRRRDVKHVSVAYFGTARLDQHGLPAFTILRPGMPAEGWIAISVTNLRSKEGYKWLMDHEPVAAVGRSIWLYYVPSS